MTALIASISAYFSQYSFAKEINSVQASFQNLSIGPTQGVHQTNTMA